MCLEDGDPGSCVSRAYYALFHDEVLESLDLVESLLKDAETGQRGFIITGEDRFL